MFDAGAQDFDAGLGEWSNEADVPLPPDHPTPSLWRILIAPRRPKKVSKGGLIIAQAARDAENHLNYVGQVIALGPLAYKSDLFNDVKDLPKVGDWVLYARYAGQPILYRGFRFLLANDKEVLARIDDPEALTVYV